MRAVAASLPTPAIERPLTAVIRPLPIPARCRRREHREHAQAPTILLNVIPTPSNLPSIDSLKRSLAGGDVVREGVVEARPSSQRLARAAGAAPLVVVVLDRVDHLRLERALVVDEGVAQEAGKRRGMAAEPDADKEGGQQAGQRAGERVWGSRRETRLRSFRRCGCWPSATSTATSNGPCRGASEEVDVVIGAGDFASVHRGLETIAALAGIRPPRCSCRATTRPTPLSARPARTGPRRSSTATARRWTTAFCSGSAPACR